MSLERWTTRLTTSIFIPMCSIYWVCGTYSALIIKRKHSNLLNILQIFTGKFHQNIPNIPKMQSFSIIIHRKSSKYDVAIIAIWGTKHRCLILWNRAYILNPICWLDFALARKSCNRTIAFSLSSLFYICVCVCE